MALLCVQLDYVGVSGQFFLLNVWFHCYTLSRKKLIQGELEALRDIIFVPARRMDRMQRFDF